MRDKLIELIQGAFNKCCSMICAQECDYYDKYLRAADRSCQAKLFADHLLANGVTIQKWIPVTERLPEVETEVLILAMRGKIPVVTTGMYEDGNKNTEDSEWWWHDHDFKYDEELDAYIIPEGWWEYKHYNGDDEYNHPIDDVVTHWMSLPEPPKEENDGI